MLDFKRLHALPISAIPAAACQGYGGLVGLVAILLLHSPVALPWHSAGNSEEEIEEIGHTYRSASMSRVDPKGTMYLRQPASILKSIGTALPGLSECLNLEHSASGSFSLNCKRT